MEHSLSNGFVIRNFLYGDASGLSRNGDNPNVAINQRECFPNPYTIEMARNWIQYVRDNEAGTRFVIANNKEAIGEIGIVIQPDVHRYSGEIGFWIGESYWGKGLMTQALDWMVDHCFQELGLKRIFADVVEYNIASQKVLQKCGFELEGVLRQNIFKNDQFFDHYVFARVNDNDPPTSH